MKIRCITMQKNEGENLASWVKYHSYLFGLENLYILDNGSTEQMTIDLLHLFEKIGCNVFWNYNKKENFEQKGNIINEIVREWDEQDNYDFVIPIDCDEYIIFYDEQPSCSREKILAYFDEIKNIQAPFLMHRMFLNVPSSPGFFCPSLVPKCFFRKGTIGHLDHGFHHPRSKNLEKPFKCKIAYLHMHNKKFDKLIEAAKEKLCHLVNINDLNALKNHVGHGEHLVQYFFMTEKEYVEKYSSKGNIFFPEFVYNLLLCGVDVENLFGGKFIDIQLPKTRTYLVRYPSVDRPSDYFFGFFNLYQYIDRNYDVREVQVDPLVHFSEFGYREYRPLNGSDSKVAVQKDIFENMNKEELENFSKEIGKLDKY